MISAWLVETHIENLVNESLKWCGNKVLLMGERKLYVKMLWMQKSLLEFFSISLPHERCYAHGKKSSLEAHFMGVFWEIIETWWRATLIPPLGVGIPHKRVWVGFVQPIFARKHLQEIDSNHIKGNEVSWMSITIPTNDLSI